MIQRHLGDVARGALQIVVDRVFRLADAAAAPTSPGIGRDGPRAAATDRHSLVPQAEAVTLPGLDHLLFIRDAKPVADAIADFLARHPM